MDNQLGRTDFDFARSDVRIHEPFTSQTHDTVCLDDVFVAERTGQFVSFGTVGRVEDNLNQAVTVSDVDEDQPAVVTVIVDPAADLNFGFGMFFCQFAASVRPEHDGDP